MKILVIDNYDSFTFNLVQLVGKFTSDIVVKRNDEISLEEIEKLNPDKIIISPGPRTPQYAGICVDLIKKYYNKKPILGGCLGLQCIGVAFGAKVVQSKKLLYGKTDFINHSSSILFNGINNTFKAARYNSLVLDSVPKNFQKIAWDNTNDIMAIQHKQYHLFGVQFHPESILTPNGEKMIRNWLES